MITKAYLFGMLHDATVSRTTYRIAQKNRNYIDFVARELHDMGYAAWTYREGKNRSVYIVEFSQFVLKDCVIQTKEDKIEYIRGYFDAEGGIAKSNRVRFYIYFAQKDLQDLTEVKQFLEEINISCGKIHNPSKHADPNYWRFFVRTHSHKDFAQIVGSHHPEKLQILRMKI